MPIRPRRPEAVYAFEDRIARESVVGPHRQPQTAT